LRVRRIISQPGFHGPYQAVHVAHCDPDCTWHGCSHCASRLDPSVEARRNGPQTHLRPGRMPDTGRYLCHALERRDRGPVVFQEFPGLHDIQDGTDHARRFARSHRADYSAISHFVGAGKAPASVAGEELGLAPGRRACAIDFERQVSHTTFDQYSLPASKRVEIMDDLDALARLTTRLENLERRVCTLEHPSATAASVPVAAAVPASRSTLTQPTAAAFPFAQDGGVFPVLGKAMLGIAGAYVLRAVAESGSFPKLAVVVLALAYAGTWLVWAARVRAEAHFVRAAYATTAALILAPMLWELTLRFEVLPPSVTAGVLSVFVVTAYALAWKRSLASVVWVTNVAAVLTTLALLIATHDLVPFVSALLLMALASEAAAGFNHWVRLRPLVAAAADIGTWILLYIYSRPDGIPSDYKNVAMPVLLALGCILFLIYGASVVFRTTRLRQKIRVFEIGQTVIAFLLAAFGVLRFGASAGVTVLGVLCLLFSASSYALAYAYFDRYHEERNYHVYATWSGALFLAGTSLCLPPTPLALCLSVAAIVATLLGVRASRLT